MSERDPSVRRLLELRQFSVFAGVELDELATLAENVVEATLPAGSVVAAPGLRLPVLQFVIEGRIESPTSAWGPRDVHGVLEVLANREPLAVATAVTDTRTLQLSGSELGEVLEDNFGVLLSVLRDLSRRVLARGITSTRRPTRPAMAGPLGLVERLITLREQVPFAKANLQALAMLAQASEELALPSGAILARLGDPADRAMVIIEGALRSQEHARTHAAGDAVGLFETFAGSRHGATIEAITPVRILASSGASLFDVLEDHTDVGLAMLGTFASALLDARAEHAN